jgi:hypothetical protein
MSDKNKQIAAIATASLITAATAATSLYCSVYEDWARTEGKPNAILYLTAISACSALIVGSITNKYVRGCLFNSDTDENNPLLSAEPPRYT